MNVPLEIKTSKEHTDSGGLVLVVSPIKHHVSLLEVGDMVGSHRDKGASTGKGAGCWTARRGNLGDRGVRKILQEIPAVVGKGEEIRRRAR